MQLSSSVLRSAVDEVVSIDPETMSGADCVRAIQAVTPESRRLLAWLSSVSARAVAANQHSDAGAKSGASWLGGETGTSEKQARRALAEERLLNECPDVAVAVRSGSLSHEKGLLIARAASGDFELCARLLTLASNESYESLERLIHDLTVETKSDGEQRWEDRSRQFVNIRREGKFHFGTFRLLTENAPWLPLWEKRRVAAGRQEISSEFGGLCLATKEAEAFSAMVGEPGGSAGVVVNFHLDVQPGQGLAEAPCELAGVGRVPFDMVEKYLADAALAFIGTSHNKLVHFGEARQRDVSKALPEMIKRAIKAYDRHSCTTQRCTGPSDEVDHSVAKCNGGDHRLELLQSKCEPCHDAKTKHDAPWTAGGIFAKTREQRTREREQRHRHQEPPGELFPDTG